MLAFQLKDQGQQPGRGSSKVDLEGAVYFNTAWEEGGAARDVDEPERRCRAGLRAGQLRVFPRV